jgi:ribulose-phosphate 3-epimerase
MCKREASLPVSNGMKYLCDPHILPTNTCPPDISELGRRTDGFAPFAKEVQLDISDGVFSPVTSWPYFEGQMTSLEKMVSDDEQLPHADKVAYEVHLMVEDHAKVGELLAAAGCSRLLLHAEAVAEAALVRKIFSSWKRAGAKEVGVALLIDTPLETINTVVQECDVVQLMSIAKIGAQGQPFDERALSRVEELHAKYPELLVAVDGGVGESNIEDLVRAGANRLCVGSAISKAPNPALAFAQLHERAMRGCAPLSDVVGRA